MPPSRAFTRFLPVAFASFLFPALAFVGCSAGPTGDAPSASSAVVGPGAPLPACVTRAMKEKGVRSEADLEELVCEGPVEAPDDDYPGAPADCDTHAPFDLSFLAQMPRLTSLTITRMHVRDLAPVGTLARLGRLDLRKNCIDDLRPLAPLRALRSLDLSDNPLAHDGGFVDPAPWSTLTGLEDLALRSTGLRDYGPLEALVGLRTLALDGAADSFSTRPLRTMKRLQKLSLAGAYVSGLEALRDARALEELDASDTMASSLEPLPSLLPSRRGHLRKVSLSRTCVPGCAPLAGIDATCDGLWPKCNDPEAESGGGALRVREEELERFTAPLPLWTQAQLAQAFDALRDGSIRWKDPRGGCNDRARAANTLLDAKGFPGRANVMAFGRLRPLVPYDRSGFVSFNWHIAVVVRAEAESGGSAFYVLDPTFVEDRPALLHGWLTRLVDSRGAKLDFDCVRYSAQPDAAAWCKQQGAMVDAKGDLGVDDLARLRVSVGPMVGP